MLKRKGRYLILTFAFLAIIALLFCTYHFYFSHKGRICFSQNCFMVDLAITPEAQAKGLMFRHNLALNKGMLFIFDKEEIYPFWMQNTYIPLDIIWLDQSKKVVFIKNNVRPCLTNSCPLIIPSQKAKYVLEINTGLVGKFDIKSGDRATIQFSH